MYRSTEIYISYCYYFGNNNYVMFCPIKDRLKSNDKKIIN